MQGRNEDKYIENRLVDTVGEGKCGIKMEKVASTDISTYMRRKWQPTPVFLPGESYGQRSLVGYSL